MSKVFTHELIRKLGLLDTESMYLNDFLHTWDKSDQQLRAVFAVAEILEQMSRRSRDIMADEAMGRRTDPT